MTFINCEKHAIMDTEEYQDYCPVCIGEYNATFRVRELHYSINDKYLKQDWCAECEYPYPCPTIKALDGEQ